MSQPTPTRINRYTLFFGCLLLSTPAFANLTGGLGKVNTTLQQILDWASGAFAIAAVLYIMWKAIETWRNRGDWGDFAMSMVNVALVGAAPALANWAYKVFA